MMEMPAARSRCMCAWLLSQPRSLQWRLESDIDCRTSAGDLFGIVPDQTRKTTDARTARTYRALSTALVDLMQSREFDAITVQDLLDRADVGRATFYSHFRNKDDFLLTDLERMLASLESHFDQTAADSRRVAPIAELFGHFRESKQFAQALERSGRMDVVLDIATGYLARIIERRLTTLNAQPRDLPLSAASRVFGAMAIELAKWWMSRETSFTALDMDERFHELVWRGLSQPQK
jgi:AcrR family transcriptional regulator